MWWWRDEVGGEHRDSGVTKVVDVVETLNRFLIERTFSAAFAAFRRYRRRDGYQR